MDNIRKISLLLFTMVLISSCNDLLNVQNKDEVSAKNAVVDVNSMQVAITGIYDLLQGSSYYDQTVYLVPDLLSDNVYSSRVTHGYVDFDRNIVQEDNSDVLNTWNQIYRVVVNSNFVIQKGSKLEVPDSDMAKKRALVGQAYAIRALAYFDLCRLFAQPYNFTDNASHPGVPILLESSFSTDNITFPKRNTVKEVYEFIVKDFKKAIERLPNTIPGESSSFKGKITLNAAKALLSRVYLYMGDWKDTEKLATDVIDSKQYSLLPTDKLVNDYSKRNNPESIFEIINSTNDNHEDQQVSYIYSQNLGYGSMLPTWDLYNSYTFTDVRRNFMRIGDVSNNGGEKDVPLVTKFRKINGVFAQDVIVIRLAEVYLNRAEAEAHMPGNESEAISDLERIAKRSDPNVVINPNKKGQELINRILLERRKELAFEGQRLFDLTRNKRSFTKYRTGGETILFNYPSEKTILPIPQRELNENKNLQQNPGY